MLDLEKDYHIYEQWLWNGVCVEGKKQITTLLLGKRLLHVLTAATRRLPEKPSNQLTVSLTYLSNLLNLLGYSSFFRTIVIRCVE